MTVTISDLADPRIELMLFILAIVTGGYKCHKLVMTRQSCWLKLNKLKCLLFLKFFGHFLTLPTS